MYQKNESVVRVCEGQVKRREGRLRLDTQISAQIGNIPVARLKLFSISCSFDMSFFRYFALLILTHYFGNMKLSISHR